MPQFFDADAVISSFEKGRERAEKDARQASLRTLGQLAAGGDYNRASANAYGLGEFELGSGLARLAQQQAESQDAMRAADELAKVLPPELGALVRANPKMALDVYAADRKEAAQAPRTITIYNEGQPQTAQWNPETGKYEPIGSPKAPAAAETKRRTQVTDVDGKRVLVDLDSGEVLKELGAAPSRAVRANNEQNLAAGFYDRMEAADAILGNPAFARAGMDRGNVYKSRIPVFGNKYVTPEYQQFEQAQRDFINAVLRKESGAAISQSEFDNAAKQYFPQPDDSPQVIAQKARNRRTVIDAMKRSAGPALEERAAGGPDTGGDVPDAAAQGFDIGDYVENDMDIPEGAVVVDDSGQAFQKIDGQLVPVQ